MRVLLAVMLFAAATAAIAIDDSEALADPVLQERYVRLANELRCLVCQNQSIADSTADLAADLRQQVREMLLNGATDREILDYMVDRYGDFVRYRPDFNPRTYALWIGPFLLLAVGLAIIAALLRRYTRMPVDGAPD